MQAVLPPSCLSSCARSSVLEKGTPTPGCHLHKEAELVALCSVTPSARTEGNWVYVAVTGRIHAADSGADGDLAPWCCKPKSLGCELKLDCGHTTLSSTMVNPYSLFCRKVCAPLRDMGKNNGKWGAVTLLQPPSYRENRIKYTYFLWRMKVNWKPHFFPDCLHWNL